MDQNPVEFLSAKGDKAEQTMIRTYLGSMRYTADEMSHCIRELSGGQKAKLLFLKMSLDGCNVLILDEPTAGLNPRAHADILNMVKNIHETERNIIFLVSHNMNDIARMSDKVIVMDCGKVAMEGPPAEVFLRENELRNMGLALPDSMEITMRLKRAGMDINSVCLTMDEAADEIAKVLKK